MASLEDITLPGSAQGQPATLVSDFLHPLFRTASELVIVSPSLEPARLARLTWGLSSFLEHGPRIKICIVLVDSVDDSSELSVQTSWHEAQSDLLVRKRLGALAWLFTNGRLKVEVRNIGPEPNEPLSTQLYEGIGFLIALDSDGTGIEIVWKEIPSTGGVPEAAIDFRWSFGDPKRTVRGLLDQLGRLSATPPCPTAAPLQELVMQYLRQTEPTPPPWQKEFEPSPAGGVTLFPHQ